MYPSAIFYGMPWNPKCRTFCRRCCVRETICPTKHVHCLRQIQFVIRWAEATLWNTVTRFTVFPMANILNWLRREMVVSEFPSDVRNFSTYLLTYSMERSPSSQEIPRIFGTRKFLTVLTSARHLSLSSANSIQSPQLPPTSWRSILILPPI